MLQVQIKKNKSHQVIASVAKPARTQPDMNVILAGTEFVQSGRQSHFRLKEIAALARDASRNDELVFGSRKVPVFSAQVYRVVAAIPKGKVLTYKQVAARAGRPRAYRAVGNIMHNHRVPGLPCHRVIKCDGSIGGYAHGTKKKAHILKREKVLFKDRKIKLK